MANVRITDLNSIPFSSITIDDVFPIVDVGGDVTYKINLEKLSKYLSGFNNRWYIESGETITIVENTQSFIYGDLVVFGELSLENNSKLVVLNGNVEISGGTVTNFGEIILVDIPEIDTKVTNFTYDNNQLTIFNNFGNPYSASLDIMTGLTINGILSATTINASIIDLCDTNGILYTDTISGCSPINFLSNSVFHEGVSATTISGDTFYGNGSNLTNINNFETTGVTLTSSQILTLGSPIEILPEPGINNYYLIERIILEYTFNTIPYDFPTSQSFYFDGCFESYIDKTLLTSSANTVCVISGNLKNTYEIGSGSGSTYVKTNKNILNSNLFIGTQDNDNPINGDGTIKIKIIYKIETFGN